MSDDRRLVYSTDRGRIKPTPPTPPSAAKSGDGIARVRRETAGRGGKTVTTISGLPLAEPALLELTKQLKQRCATGGHLRDGVIEIQGDHRDRIMATLEQLGHRAKRAGG